MQRLQVERVGRLKDLLQEANEPFGANRRSRQAVEAVLDLACRTDAHFVPVEEAVTQRAKSPVGVFAGGPFTADPVDELFEHRPWLRLGVVVLLVFREKLGQDFLFVDGGRHTSFAHPFIWEG